MRIAEDLKTKLYSNQRIIFITDADDLLAVWQFKRKNKFRRSFNFSRVPKEWRCSIPPKGNSPLMPCHVSILRKKGRCFSTVKPAFEYSTSACHGHGRMSTISVQSLDTLEAVTFAKRNVAPYVSPILDAGTLALVCKDLGITGRAIPKVINGHQYIAFVNTSGVRQLFPSTLYASNNRKIITMAIGALGIKNMVKSGGVLTICITVPLTILEAYLKDHSNIYALAGNIASDLIKIGIASIVGAIFGLAIGGVTTIAALPIAVTIGVCVFANWVLEGVDRHYQLTDKLIAALQDMGDEIDKMGNEAKTTIYRGMDGFFRSQGLRIPNY